jgi:hypothetical protein
VVQWQGGHIIDPLVRIEFVRDRNHIHAAVRGVDHQNFWLQRRYFLIAFGIWISFIMRGSRSWSMAGQS